MSRLCIVTALPAESRALLDGLKLRQKQARHLRLYGNATYLLLETGAGKLSAAAGVGAVMQAYPDIRVIVNIGIAGGSFDFAQTLCAHHIRDHASGAQWFPHLPDHSAFRAVQSASVKTLDAPDSQYCEGVLFDMEAAGIFSAASRYLSSSQMHSIKVVSDNHECSIEKITKNSVIALISQALPTILPMLQALHDSGLAMSPPHDANSDALIMDTINRVHHSVNDVQLLKQLVQQYVAMTDKLPLIDTSFVNAKSIRQALHVTIDETPFIYGDH